jgi:hypothetical protein
MIPSGETLYTFRTPYPDVLVRGRACIVDCRIYRNGAVVAPASATFTLYDRSTTAVVSAATVLTPFTTYTIPALSLPSTLSLGEGYRELFQPVVDGVTLSFERTAALARIPLSPTVTDADLLGLYPTWSRALGTVITSFQTWIDEAWKRIIGRLIKDGHLPYLIRTPDALREAHLHLSIALAARGVKPTSGSGESTWLADAQYHEGLYEAAWGSATWQADYDNDGNVDDPTTRQRTGGARLTTWGAPPGYRGPPSWV